MLWWGLPLLALLTGSADAARRRVRVGTLNPNWTAAIDHDYIGRAFPLRVLERAGEDLDIDFAVVGPFYSNYTQAGLALADGVWDFFAADWWPSLPEAAYLDFTTPYRYDGGALLLLRPGEGTTGLWGFVEPFESSLWMALLCVMPCAALVMAAAEWDHRYTTESMSGGIVDASLTVVLRRSFWYVVQQPYGIVTRAPKSTLGRVGAAPVRTVGPTAGRCCTGPGCSWWCRCTQQVWHPS
eukprot:TRINITY_DN12210_c0_g1_i2.p2 TRINITY_DN12210_c0_g1~~TRINITY_DN12210_c0_g1_i2.p2  ORF type:complete len:240 (+),score=31.22 TRINITY_DN12210_c0_g1_i2:66-785(+)